MTNFYQSLTKEERISMLKNDFKKLGLEMRDDSKLCSKFIETGFLTNYNSTLKIATRMAEMHYLYNYTDYSKILKEKTEAYNKRIQAGKIHYIKPQVEAEYIVLKGGDYPETWPWQM